MRHDGFSNMDQGTTTSHGTKYKQDIPHCVFRTNAECPPLGSTGAWHWACLAVQKIGQYPGLGLMSRLAALDLRLNLGLPGWTWPAWDPGGKLPSLLGDIFHILHRMGWEALEPPQKVSFFYSKQLSGNQEYSKHPKYPVKLSWRKDPLLIPPCLPPQWRGALGVSKRLSLNEIQKDDCVKKKKS